MTITLNADQVAVLKTLLAGRQSTPQCQDETLEELASKVVEMGLMQMEYRRKYNQKNYAEYKVWKQSTK